MKHASLEAVELFRQGTLAFARMERNGICIDVPLLEETIKELNTKIRNTEDELRGDKVYRIWQREFGSRLKFGAKEQLAHVLYNKLGFTGKQYTNKLHIKADKNAFEKIDHPFVRKYRLLDKYTHSRKKLEEIQREVVRGFVHPSYNLNTVISYRPSTNDPNFANIPVRDKDTARIVRSCVVPTGSNYCILGFDFKSIEVSVNACYSKDPNLMAYCSDSKKDMHRDCAAQLFKIKKGQVSHHARFYAKNQFVFPEFYGSYWLDCSRHLWETLHREKLRLKHPIDPPKEPSGPLLSKMLADEGITELGDQDQEGPKEGTFEEHVYNVEHHFWEKRFPRHAEWKREWKEKYRSRGWMETLTGFVISGYLSNNQIVDIPVQGSAFHILLWTLIQVDKWLLKRKMKTRIISQVYDSLLLNTHKDELQDVIEKVVKIATVDVRKHWNWIAVPLTIEAELGEKNWHEMKDIPT